MQFCDEAYLFSATDLVGFLECEHLTVLELQSLYNADARASKSVPDESAALASARDSERGCIHRQHQRQDAGHGGSADRAHERDQKHARPGRRQTARR